MIIERVPEAWAQFQSHIGGLSRPRSEQEYEQLIALMHHLSDSYDSTSEPYAALFDFLATMAHDWEAANEPEFQNPDVAPPHTVLAYLMEEHGVSQYQLAQEGIADQGNLSRILAGERSINKNLAKALAARFSVSVEAFR